MPQSRFFPAHQLSECEAHVQGLQMARKAPKTARKGVTLPSRSERTTHTIQPLTRWEREVFSGWADAKPYASKPLKARKGVITPVVNPYDEHAHRVDGVRAPLKVEGGKALPPTAYVATGIAVRGVDPVDALFRGVGFA